MVSNVSDFASPSGGPSSIRVGTFSYLPTFQPEEIAKQIDYLLSRGLEPAIEHVEPVRARVRYWHLWKLPLFGERSREAIETEIEACRAENPGDFIRLIGYDTKRQTQVVSFVVNGGWTKNSQLS